MCTDIWVYEFIFSMTFKFTVYRKYNMYVFKSEKYLRTVNSTLNYTKLSNFNSRFSTIYASTLSTDLIGKIWQFVLTCQAVVRIYVYIRGLVPIVQAIRSLELDGAVFKKYEEID
jgi:hypothetical protein